MIIHVIIVDIFFLIFN